MMDDHIGYIVAAFAISAIGLVGLAVWIMVRDRRLRAEAARLGKKS